MNALDKTNVACYLANGAIYHVNSPEYIFDNSYAHRSYKSLQYDLSDLLVKCVKKSFPLQQHTTYLSLSAGYDARTILGVFGTLKEPNVTCLSYCYGKLKKSSDEYISQKLAKHYNYQHRLISSFHGDLVSLITNNSRIGVNNHFCHELDVWQNFNAPSNSICFFGDECFGWSDVKLSIPKEALHAVLITDFSSLSWLKPYIGINLYNELSKRLDALLENILAACPQYKDLHDLKDWLYLTQRISTVIMPWRYNVIKRFINVADPFLDDEIIRFMTKIPSKWRRGKKLFKDTARKMFPELFRFPFAATSSFQDYFPKALITQKNQIKALINAEDSLLDDIIPPDIILKILDSYSYDPKSSIRQAAISVIKHHTRNHILFFNSIRNVYKKCIPISPVSTAKFLERVITLRTAFTPSIHKLHQNIP